jgi:hypothetical protein
VTDSAEKTIIRACFEEPPYKLLKSGKEAINFSWLLESTPFTHDTFCTGCGREGTFKRIGAKQNPTQILQAGIPVHRHSNLLQEVSAACTRDHTMYTFYFGPYRGGIAKVGQNPSMLDIASEEIRRFRGILDDQDMDELARATMLFTHQVAIGAFVYLRRIFERLLERHHRELVSASGPIDGFETMHVDQKVLALKESLPKEVVENRKVYSILSKGIHSLTEDQCVNYYKIIHAALIEILERDIYERQRLKTAAELRGAIATIVGELKD